MIAFRALTHSAAFAAVLALVACGGGGGGGSTASTVPSAHPTAPATPAGPTAQVTLRIDTSTITTSSATRSPKFISPNTQSVTVALQGGAVLANVNITPSSPSCVNGTCTITLSAPVGSDTFVITTWDGPGGTGNQLSTATTLVTVVANTTNTIAIALGGVVATATVILGSSSVPAGTPATVAVTVAAYDVHNNLIIGPGNYSSPVTLTDSDFSGVTQLSAPQITGPGGTVNLVYNGGSTGGVTITPFVGTTPGTAATFAPTGYGFASFALLLPTTVGNVDTSTGAGGNVWFSDDEGDIGFITPTGSQTVFTTQSGTSIYGLAMATNGIIWFGDNDGDLGSIATNGSVNYLSTFPPVLPNANNCEGQQPKSIGRRSAQSSTPVEITCGAINYMAPDVNGNVWFSDDDGFIGVINSTGVATEWDIAQLPNWNGGVPEPWQFVFGGDGNIYAADSQGLIDMITVSGGQAMAAQTITSPVSCPEGGATGIGIDTNSTLWTGDDCSNLFALFLGAPVTPANFNQSNLQAYSISTVSSGNSLGLFASTPSGAFSGVFAIDYFSNVVYRINEVFNTAPVQPAITTFTEGSTNLYSDTLTIGSDTNLWVGFTNQNGATYSSAMVRTSFGAPTIGTQSLVRKLPRATSTAGRNAAILAKRRPHRSHRR